MEMIERYIYAVTRRLPHSQREDIATELRSLITDMLEEREGELPADDRDVEAVLFQLGSPDDLAAKYLGSKRYVIGPQLFHPYIRIIKIVVTALVTAMTVIFAIETIIAPADILEHFVSFIVSVFAASTQAFAWITIGFAIAEYTGASSRKKQADEWQPSELPPVPDAKREIKRGETIFGIIISILFLVFAIFSDHLFGVIVFNEQQTITVIPFLNLEILSSFMPIIYLIVAVGIFKECLKLIMGKWTKRLAHSNLLLNVVTIGLVMLLLNGKAILNPNFLVQLSQQTSIGKQVELYKLIAHVWEHGAIIALFVFSVAIVIDTASVYYKAFRN